MTKKDLLNMMHAAGFDWICDVDVIHGVEYVASKRSNGSLWWRKVEVEGSGFEQLFKGSIKEASK